MNSVGKLCHVGFLVLSCPFTNFSMTTTSPIALPFDSRIWPLRGILYPCVRVLCHCLMVPWYWKQAVCRSSALAIMILLYKCMQMCWSITHATSIQKNSIRQQFCTGLRVTESWIEYSQLYRLDSFSVGAGLYMTFASRTRSRSIKATLEDASC